MKTIGVIGGLGPETTAEFYLEIVFGTYKKNKQQRPPILIWNVPLRYDIEEDLIRSSKGEERYIPYLVAGAKKLERGGADFIVMPCNSLHIFIEDIRKAVKIPVLSIVEETAKFLREKKFRNVGLLATRTALKSGLYETALKKEGISQIVPHDKDQAMLGEIINNIDLSRHAEKDKRKLVTMINKFEGKADAVILACTDLQLLMPEHDKLEIYDTMKIFAESTVNFCLKQ